MNTLKRLNKLYMQAPRLGFDDNSKLVLCSDCHRGDGSWADIFANNQNLYFHALSYYYNQGFTYIELGDGDELWENHRLSDIINIHSHIYWLLGCFYREKRYVPLYGNHDMIKMDGRHNICLYNYFDVRSRSRLPLCPNIRFLEALVLRHAKGGKDIFLLHGHQVDYFNYDWWRLARFLVRYLWRPLVQLVGFNDPTNTAKNYRRRDLVERRLLEWVKNSGQMLVAGHTHRPAFPLPQEPPYFNDGSCVHPRCITCIELEQGCIALVKWQQQTKTDGTLFVGREILEGPHNLGLYLGHTPAPEIPAEAQPAHKSGSLLKSNLFSIR